MAFVVYPVSTPFLVSGSSLCSGRHGSRVASVRGRCIVNLGSTSPPAPEPADRGQDAENTDGDTADAVEQEGEEVTAEGVDDLLSSPEMLKKRIQILQEKIQESEKAQEEFDKRLSAEKDSYLRLKADFENFRRRSAEELREVEEKAAAKVLGEFLSVLDSFERAAMSVVPQTDKEISINDAYQGINKQFIDTLAKLRVEAIEAEGQMFDAQLHNAIQSQESTEIPDGVVITQYQRGFKIGDRLIRPSMCLVSTGPGPEQGTDGIDEEELIG